MEHRFGVVALMGPPNAGKSTLLNHLLGQKLAIVSPKPQTTRNRISGILTRPDAQVVLLDTPGVHRQRGRMNRFLLDSAWSALQSADAAVLLADAALGTVKPGLFEQGVAPLVDPLRRFPGPAFVAANKTDGVRDKKNLLPVLKRLSEAVPGAQVFPVSAKTGQGVPELLEAVIAALPEGPAMYPEDQISTVPLRFMAAEAVREKLFLELKQELPYSTAVEIEQWEEGPASVTIHAVIFAARDNHKGIVIGKGGETLKRIGTAARADLEALLETKVNLKLWVKIRPDWTEDPGFLRTLGLGE